MQDSVNLTSTAANNFFVDQKKLSAEEMQVILNDRAQRFRREEVVDDENLQEMIVFVQSSTQYAIPLDMLSEIRPVTRLTPLPMVNKCILGLINVRGRIVPLYVFSSDHTSNKETGFALVGYGKAAHLALWAEDIIGTLRVSTSDIKISPISLNEKDYIKGVGSDGMVYIDLEKFINNPKLYLA